MVDTLNKKTRGNFINSIMAFVDLMDSDKVHY